MSRTTALFILIFVLAVAAPVSAQRFDPGSDPFVGWPVFVVVVAGQPGEIPITVFQSGATGGGDPIPVDQISLSVDPVSKLGVPIAIVGDDVIYLPPPFDYSDHRDAYFDVFNYHVTLLDGGDTVTGPAHIYIVNNPPLPVRDAFLIPKGVDVTLPVLGNDFDPDGHPMNVVSVSPPECGTATTDGTTVTVNFPLECPDTPVSMVYEIEDAFGLLNFAGDRLEVYFDPAYSITSPNLLDDGGFEFGTFDNPWKYPPEPDLIQCSTEKTGVKPSKYVTPHSGQCMLYANNLKSPVTIKQSLVVSGHPVGIPLHIEVWADHLGGKLAKKIVLQAVFKDADGNTVGKLKLAMDEDFDDISRPTAMYFSPETTLPMEEFALNFSIKLSPGGKYWLDDVAVVAGGGTTFDMFNPIGLPPVPRAAPQVPSGFRGPLPPP